METFADHPVAFMGEPLTDANRGEARAWAECECNGAFEKLARIGGAALVGDEVGKIALPFAVRRAARAERLVWIIAFSPETHGGSSANTRSDFLESLPRKEGPAHERKTGWNRGCETSGGATKGRADNAP